MSGPLKKYRYRGTVLKLNGTDAARLGLTDADMVGAPDPAPAAEPEAVQQPAEVKARAGSANKARTAANKGRRSKPAASTETAPAPVGDQDETSAAEVQGDGAGDSDADGGQGGGG